VASPYKHPLAAKNSTEVRWCMQLPSRESPHCCGCTRWVSLRSALQQWVRQVAESAGRCQLTGWPWDAEWAGGGNLFLCFKVNIFARKVNLGLYGLYWALSRLWWARRAALWRALSIPRSICSANLDRPLCCRLAVWQGRRGHPLRRSAGSSCNFGGTLGRSACHDL